jgi:hypothetical protein
MAEATSAPRGFKPHRIDTTSHDLASIAEELADHGPFDRLLLAEGDSWFDLFTPFGSSYQPNLLNAIRSTHAAALVDLSRIGDTARQMTSGWQVTSTARLLDIIEFDAWLVSAGGNDLKNIFAELYGKAVIGKRPGFPPLSAFEARALANPAGTEEIYDRVIADIVKLVALRDSSEKNRDTPMIFHGYDHLQPRPAGAVVIPGFERGPWLYPVLSAYGMNDAEMLHTATAVINTFNAKLEAALRGKANVFFLDQRGTLQLASPGTTAASNDWADEIHPLPKGFEKLADGFWNPLLESVLA